MSRLVALAGWALAVALLVAGAAGGTTVGRYQLVALKGLLFRLDTATGEIQGFALDDPDLAADLHLWPATYLERDGDSAAVRRYVDEARRRGTSREAQRQEELRRQQDEARRASDERLRQLTEERKRIREEQQRLRGQEQATPPR